MGMLKRFKINREGSFSDGKQVSSLPISALNLTRQPQIQMKVGVKSGARYQGGVNLYGRKFGNIEQDIVMRLWYEFREGERPYVIK